MTRAETIEYTAQRTIYLYIYSYLYLYINFFCIFIYIYIKTIAKKYKYIYIFIFVILAVLRLAAYVGLDGCDAISILFILRSSNEETPSWNYDATNKERTGKRERCWIKKRKKGKRRERKEREKKKREKGRKTYHVSCDFQDGRLRVITGTRHLTISSSLFSKSSEYSGFSLVPRAASLDCERYDCSSKIFDARNSCTLFLSDTQRKNCTYGISFRRANWIDYVELTNDEINFVKRPISIR